MFGKILINGIVLLALLLTPAWGEDLLPAGVKNTVQEDFGIVALSGDYGLGNVTPVEVVGKGERREVRIFRSPELRLYRKHASMQVLLGDIRQVYVWVETPPVMANWHLTVDLLYQDGTRRNLYSRNLKPGSRDYIDVEPHTRLDCQIYFKTSPALKLDRQFILNVSPLEMWATWPDFLPIPHHTIID